MSDLLSRWKVIIGLHRVNRSFPDARSLSSIHTLGRSVSPQASGALGVRADRRHPQSRPLLAGRSERYPEDISLCGGLLSEPSEPSESRDPSQSEIPLDRADGPSLLASLSTTTWRPLDLSTSRPLDLSTSAALRHTSKVSLVLCCWVLVYCRSGRSRLALLRCCLSLDASCRCCACMEVDGQ